MTLFTLKFEIEGLIQLMSFGIKSHLNSFAIIRLERLLDPFEGQLEAGNLKDKIYLFATKK